MKKIGYLLSSVIILLVILFIILHEIKGDYYRLSVEEAYTITQNERILIRYDALDSINPEPLIIYLSENPVENSISAKNYKNLMAKPAELLNLKYRKIYRHTGNLVLWSDNPGLSAGAWVILNRKGYKNIKILGDPENETFKYSFQPDSLAGLK
ncbi:MAG: hypothetical protein JXJ22_06860 [Bacteroidales bacterium]|nr:hypothetical protein [Bacteroidales bacterium]